MEAASDVALAGLTLLITFVFLLSSVAMLERWSRRSDRRTRAHRGFRNVRPILPERRQS